MTVLVFELFGRDNSAGRTFDALGRSSDNAGRKVAGFGKDADSSSGPVGKLTGLLGGLGDKLTGLVTSGARAATTIGAVASTALTLAPLVAKAASSVGQVVSASIAAAPALLAMGAAGLFVKDTLGRIGPAIGASMGSIPEMFTRAGNAASVLATRNLPELSAGFAKANFPAVSSGMNAIATATNGVVSRFLEWGRSAPGVEAIRNLTTSTGLAMQTIGPKVSRVVESFGNMIGRIAGVSMAAGSSGLSGVLDRLAGWFDRVNAATVSTGLAELKADYLAVRDAVASTVAWIKQATEFWREHRTAITAAQDVLSVAAIAVGIAMGGWLIPVIAGVGIIIRHWSDLKAAGAGVATFLATPSGQGFMDGIRSASESLWPSVVGAWNTIRSVVGPVLSEIWSKIQNQLIPALGAFVAAIAPVVSFMVNVLAPVVAQVWRGIGQIISGAVSVITGILNVFTGLLTLNWSRAWQGVKQILSGAWQAIVGIFNVAIFSRIGGLLARVPGFLGGFFASAGRSVLGAVGSWIGALVGRVGGIPGMILRALGNLGSLLYQAGRNVIQGLINGIRSMVGAVGSAIGSIARKIRNMLPFSPAKEGPLSGAGSPERSGAKIPSMIATGMLKGVPQVVGAAYQLAGAADLSMPRQGSLLGVGAASTAPTQVVVRLDLHGDGSREVDRAMEMIRKAVSDRGGNVQAVLGR